MNSIKLFNTSPFINALKAFFEELKVPFNLISEYQTQPQNIIGDKKCNQNIKAIYPFGIVTDAIFNQEETKITQTDLENEKYEGILLFGVDVSKTNPTRSDLAEITRQINRAFKKLPVVVVFKYGNQLTFANIERIDYEQQWHEGEKVGKVSMLKDIDLEKPHRAHQDILKEIGKQKANNFEELYQYWQKVLNTKELNTKFYQELFKWYLWAKDNVSFPNDTNEEEDKYLSESLIRFISRMLFVWFMKEKNLITKQIFELEDLKNILNDFDETSNKNIYYKTILQNLFFATLNVPIEERKWIDGKKRNKAQIGDPLIYRFEKEFINSDAVIENIFMKIPFLNGGLFDCLDDRSSHVFTDGFTKNEKKQPKFPNFLFFGEHKNIDLSNHFSDDAKEKKKWQNQNIFGIIDLLNNYKFTIEENTPLEIDVALDPELLGKVFENLLASFNPETKATARKQTGSFYTPREIVNYMVDESLLAYLQNDNSDLTTFEKLSHLQPEQKYTIVNKLFDCKILDPACGSGAYPMGVLHKMVQLMTLLDPKNEHLKQIEGKKLDQLIAGAKTLSDTNARNQTIEALQKQKNILQNAQYDYVRKLYIIENCIYGVDIQPIAIQISKLRFFISLLVEQNKKEDQPNFGIEPLPNMDFKLVAANTLIAPPQEDKGIGLFANHDPFFDDFERLAHDYFTLHTPESKKTKKHEIIKLINTKIEEKKRLVASSKNFKALEESVALWESYQNLFKEKAVGFFETPYFFPKVKDGFDIVIGNPPYVGEKGNKETFELLKKSLLGERFYVGKMDLFYFFFHFGLDVLKTGGNLNFITTNYYITATGAKKLRKDFEERSTILSLINFNEYKVFGSALGQHNMITNLMRGQFDILAKTTNINKKGFIDNVELLEIFNKKNTNANYGYIVQEKIYKNDNIVLGNDNIDDVLNKINHNQQLVQFCDVKVGLRTGIDRIGNNHLKIQSDLILKDSVFVINKNEIEQFSKIDFEIIKPLFKNSNIKRWYVGSDFSHYVIYATKKTNISSYKNIELHLLKFKKLIETIRNNNSEIWYSIVRPRDYSIFVNEKIVCSQRKLKNEFAYDNSEFFCSSDVYYIVNPKKGISLKFILAILNSKLIYKWLYYRGKRKGEMLELYQEPLSKIPIKTISEPAQLPFITLVNQILENKKSGIATSHLEHQIDVMVYHLYGLSFVEAQIIDTDLQKEDFEKFKN